MVPLISVLCDLDLLICGSIELDGFEKLKDICCLLLLKNLIWVGASVSPPKAVIPLDFESPMTNDSNVLHPLLVSLSEKVLRVASSYVAKSDSKICPWRSSTVQLILSSVVVVLWP